MTSDADDLLSALRRQIDDDMLHEIAAADYGNDLEEHLAALRPIRDAGEIALPLPWEPREVLELIRWSEPDDPQWRPGGAGWRGQLMRAFACTVLLRAGAEPEQAPYGNGENQTLAQLLASLLELGHEEQEAGLRFLRWCAERIPAGMELPFYRTGQLILAVHLHRPGQAEAELGALARQVEADEAAERAAVGVVADDRWLLGLTFHQLRHTVWVRLVDQLLKDSARIADPEDRDAVGEVALRILCG